MENEKIKKIDWLYMLIFLLAPVVVLAGGTALLVRFSDGTGPAAFIPFLLAVGALVWWTAGAKNALKSGAAKLAKAMDEQGLTRNMTFNGKGCVVIVDVEHGKLGLVYAKNPRKQYIIPASRVEKAWTDDGKTGKGITEGTMRVSFLFTVDGIQSRVDTFTSNTRWKMDHPNILEAISKADSMVEMITAAKGAR